MTDAALGDRNLAAVAALLDKFGVAADDLLALSGARRTVPTFGEYIPVVIAAMPANRTRESFGAYWRRLLAQPGWSDKRLDEATATELKGLIESLKATRQVRRNDRGGWGTAYNATAAIRHLYRQAQNDGLIDAGRNPARHLPVPAKMPSSRLAIPDEILVQINRFAAISGNDPELDTLILRLHTETACRQIGALRLRPQDLDPAQSLVLLREKRWVERWQPVSPTLMAALLKHQQDGGAAPSEPLLRYRDGRPLTRERYNYLWERLRKYVPVVDGRGITIHWIRHTTVTWVERNFGKAVARAFAGHGVGSVTDIYTEATIHEVAAALAALTGEPHPLAGSLGLQFPPLAAGTSCHPGAAR
ncbi:tyrosine-type recombinase/integrase [Nocardia wallacei]|uniref:tyrosine-type recombinase/integrase n=1 Tax=Nocardia wallacei TaxID=480035 RepID=UPI00245649AE|nr:site-specific integrase [Nocardia wallacei]